MARIVSKEDTMKGVEMSKESRRKTQAAINVKTLVTRRRKPGDIASVKMSIRNHCQECMGWEGLPFSIQECTSDDCWLYPWRLGTLDKQFIGEE